MGYLYLYVYVISGTHDAHKYDEQVDMDVASSEDKKVHWNILDMTFECEQAAFVWYNSYARERGFSIRKDLLKQGKGPNGEIQLRRYVCSRQEKHLEKLLTEEGHK
jgi:hypothetical protein